LKRGKSGKSECESIKEEEGEEEFIVPKDAGTIGTRLKRLPCTRFYLEERNDTFNVYVNELLGATGAKQAMLRTQQTLVISPVSSRWFVVDVIRPLRLLVGATTEGQERLQPNDPSRMKIIAVDLKGRGDRVKLLVMPSLGYAPPADGDPNPPPGDNKFKLNGDLTVFVNDTRIGGKFEHDFHANDNIYGIAIWQGSLHDVKLVEY